MTSNPPHAARPNAATDDGLMRRGLLLFGLLAVIAAAVLYVIFGSGAGAAPGPELARPELLAASLHVPGGGFPGGVGWGAAYEIGEKLPSPGWEIRYAATVVLARRGSENVPLDTLAEILDEQRQLKNFRVVLDDGRAVSDETGARRMVLSGLQALTRWHGQIEKEGKLGPTNADLEPLYGAVRQLAESPNEVVRTEARKAMEELGLR